MAKFGSFQFGEEVFGAEPAGVPGGSGGSVGPVPVRVPWVFQELHTAGDFVADSYEFAINPLDANMPSVERTLSSQPTTAGNQVIFQGRRKPQRLSFSGTILTEDHYNAMRTWSRMQKQVRLTDDLGRSYWIYIKSFSPTRDYHPDFPWRHQFSCEAVVLDWLW